MAQILVRWKKPQDVKYGRSRKKIPAQEAIVKGHPERFAVYQVPSPYLTTMWALADLKGGSTHFLYATGWEQAREVAAGRIREILFPKPKKKSEREQAAHRIHETLSKRARAKRATASRAPSRRPSA